MKQLEERIIKYGQVIMPDILKVDSFINHQIDVRLFEEMGKEFKRIFQHRHINKIMTIEASGIAIAVMTAREFDYCPAVFVKKSSSKILNDDVYHTSIHSFTKDNDYEAMISKSYLSEDDHVLIIDDFLASGEAVLGMIDLCHQAHATVEGVGIIIEKGFQLGRERIEAQGIEVHSLACITYFDENHIVFGE